MQNNNDRRNENELEIETFLSQFEPDDNDIDRDDDIEAFLEKEALADSADSVSEIEPIEEPILDQLEIEDLTIEEDENIDPPTSEPTKSDSRSEKSGFFSFFRKKNIEPVPVVPEEENATIEFESIDENQATSEDTTSDALSGDETAEAELIVEEPLSIENVENDTVSDDLVDEFITIDADDDSSLNEDIAAGAAYVAEAIAAEQALNQESTEQIIDTDDSDSSDSSDDDSSSNNPNDSETSDSAIRISEDASESVTDSADANAVAAMADAPLDKKAEKLKKQQEKQAEKERKAQEKQAEKERKAQEKQARKDEGRTFFSHFALFVPNPKYKADEGDYYMEDDKKIKNKKKKFSFKHLILDLFLLGVIAVLAFMIYAFVTISMAPKIEPEKLYDNIAQSSTVYDQDGKVIESVYYSEDRKICDYEDMSPDLINAFVALEDKTFWDHHGFNWTRMIGAVVQAITGGGSIQGTSTITQQLARNVYLPDEKSERSIKRKVLEMYYARELERNLSKEEIVEAYLNTIYLGYGCYGVEAASKAYFSKSPSELSVIQCAALAALPQAPDSYALVQYVADSDTIDDNDTVIKKKPDKYVANDESKDRRDTCLALMLEQGYITQEQYDKNVGKDLTDFIKAKTSSNRSTYAYFHEYMIDQVITDLMEKYDYTEDQASDLVYTGGLNIYSTIDSTAQKVIVKEFKDDSNFPGLMGYSTDGDGNIVSSSGNIMLYDYDNFFNDKGDFKLKKKECTINEDGSLTIKTGNRLNIYTTKVGDEIDYSLEFKATYTMDTGTLYMYNGGYINIPAQYKTLDEDDNLVISADYFTDYPDHIKLGEETATITDDAYTLPEKTIQPQASMVIVEVGTGEVKAMVGGRKQTGQSLFNRALNPRQSGSSIKPLTVYAGSLQKSLEYAEKGQKFPYINTGRDKQGTRYYGDYLTASSVIIDERMTFNGRSWPQNAGGGYSGAVTMRKALQNSINVCAVKLELQLGDEYCADLVEKFGITTLDREGDTNDLNPAALALGGFTNGVIPLEMAQAYAAFPNGGVRQSSIAYTKVTDREGNVILESESESTRVLDEGVAFIMTDMLKSVVSQGIGGSAWVNNVQSGGKTGTTSNEYDIWFDGFTPTYAAVLWIGTDVNIQLTSMSGTAAALWGKIMRQIPNALKGSYPSQPDNVVMVGSEYYTNGTQTGRSTYYAEKAAEEAKKKAEAAKKKAEEAKKKAAEAAANAANDDDDNDDD